MLISNKHFGLADVEQRGPEGNTGITAGMELEALSVVITHHHYPASLYCTCSERSVNIG
jgi:hypothetical protein